MHSFSWPHCLLNCTLCPFAQGFRQLLPSPGMSASKVAGDNTLRMISHLSICLVESPTASRAYLINLPNKSMSYSDIVKPESKRKNLWHIGLKQLASLDLHLEARATLLALPTPLQTAKLEQPDQETRQPSKASNSPLFFVGWSCSSQGTLLSHIC